jgi:hypothetical protein
VAGGTGGGTAKQKRFWKDVHVKKVDGMVYLCLSYALPWGLLILQFSLSLVLYSHPSLLARSRIKTCVANASGLIRRISNISRFSTASYALEESYHNTSS